LGEEDSRKAVLLANQIAKHQIHPLIREKDFSKMKENS